ncbi:MAG: peptide deformylase [Thermoguttaceae bacterium]
MNIIKYPHPVLKQQCKPVVRINQELRELVRQMFELMYESDGVGLAANQVGLPLQLFVMNSTGNKEKPDEEHVFINPVILKRKGKAEDSEGCLSYPGINASVVRSKTIDVEAITLTGDVVRFKWSDHPARVVQHEMDHLNGIGFVDRISATFLKELEESLDELETVFEGDRRLGFIASDADIDKERTALLRQFCE